MYLQHFGLRELPFRLTPDTDFFFNQATHHEALNVLQVALRTGEGYLKITGEVGTGKTLLCRMLLNGLGPRFVTAYIPNPMLTPAALRMALGEELGLEFQRNIGQHRLLKLIAARLIQLAKANKRVVLVLDEAQAMPTETLETLRLLTNLETEKQKLLQVVMFGQPELDARLRTPAIRQLRQRVTFSHEILPLNDNEVAAYVDFRLLKAGHNGPPLFSHRCFRKLHKFSRGIPRLINVLSHKALMAAYGSGAKRVSINHIRQAALDTEDVDYGFVRPKLFGFRLAGASSLLATGLGIYMYWGNLV